MSLSNLPPGVGEYMIPGERECFSQAMRRKYGKSTKKSAKEKTMDPQEGPRGQREGADER